MNENKFWVIWNELGTTPTYRHTSIDSVIKELDRLCKKHPNTKFYVLSNIGEGIGTVNILVNRFLY